MATKKEFTVKIHRDANEAWCGSAYFINPTLGKRYVVSCATSPYEKKIASVSRIREQLIEHENDMRKRHPDWIRCTEEEYDNFSVKR